MIIRGGLLITAAGPVPADLQVAGAVIAAVTPPGAADPSPGEEVFSAAGRWILPGGVDVHTHFGMPLRPGVASLGWRESSEAALLGGTTTIIDFANPEPGESLAQAVDRWLAMAGGACLCDFGLHCTVSDTAPERLAEIPALVARGIPTFKGFLAYKGRLMLTESQMGLLMTRVKAAGGMLLVHAEDGEMNAAAEQVLLATGRTTPNWHPTAHPPESEQQAVARCLALALEHACPLTVVHLSLEDSLAALEAARQRRQDGGPDLPLIGEVCLHHLLADDGLYRSGHESALAALCSPPLRPPRHGRGLVQGLAAGRIDILSTDHCEFPLAVKAAAAAGGFPRVPNGCGGVGERITLSYSELVRKGRLGPGRWIEAVAAKPAEIMGLSGRKGRLQPGYDADIVCFDPQAEGLWQPLGSSDRAGNLYKDLPVTGQVTDVWLRGRRVVDRGRLCGDQPGGEFLPRLLS
ncbi:MAG: amidohydrolase family protein [bacterium]